MDVLCVCKRAVIVCRAQDKVLKRRRSKRLHRDVCADAKTLQKNNTRYIKINAAIEMRVAAKVLTL